MFTRLLKSIESRATIVVLYQDKSYKKILATLDDSDIYIVEYYNEVKITNQKSGVEFLGENNESN